MHGLALGLGALLIVGLSTGARPTLSGRPAPASGPENEPSASLANHAGSQNATGWTALQFADPQHGWVAGRGFILATADGGQTWAPQLSTTDPIASFAFVGARTGWAVGAHALLGTSDGGQRWERRGNPDVSVTRVSFATPDLGWGLP